LIQDEPGLLRIRAVKARGYSDKDTHSILEGLKERLGHSMRYEFEFMEEIPRDRNGKFRFVINRVAKDEAAHSEA